MPKTYKITAEQRRLMITVAAQTDYGCMEGDWDCLEAAAHNAALLLKEFYADYEDARKRLIELAPCPKCCPPRSPCSPGERIVGCDIVRCGRCGGDGFLINWDSEGDE